MNGTLIAGKYRLQLRLGSGGMAEVWSATNRFTEGQVAIKLLSREAAAKDPDATQRFLNEAKVSARVDHPNIVHVIDVGQTDDGQLFLVMELLTGVPLETALRRQTPPMTFHELALVMIDIASALQAAHAAGIVHRDLKPANVFLHKTKSGVRPTVLDFGVSKFLAPGDGDHSVTLAGTVLGSPLYMSPEQARGETHIDGRTDIFAFGGMLFEAIAGFRAYEAKNFNALIVQIATSRPKSIDEHAPGVPESLRKVVRVCLEPSLDRRAPSFAAVAALLRAALPELAAKPARIPPTQIPAALFDPDATNALPMFSSTSEPLAMPERTTYEAALPAREVSHPSPWIVVGVGGAIIAGIALWSLRAQPVVYSTPPRPATEHNPEPQVTELVITATPGSCTVGIDGADRGSTPATLRDVGAGEHAVTCRPANGTPRSANVTVGAGSTTRYRFLLSD